VGCNRRTRATYARVIRLRGQRRRSTRAGLWHLVTHVRRDVEAAHVSIVGSLTVQARNYTCRHAVGRRQRHGTVIRRGCVQGRSVFGIVAAVGATSPARCGSTRGQGSSGRSSGLFNGASVMVLVACQGGATRKCFLAIGIRALVGSLPRVNTTMPSQRARVTERLGGKLAMSMGACCSWVAYLATSLTHVWFLAGVDTLVDGQSRALNELLAAVGVVAHVRTDPAVDTFWGSQCVLLVDEAQAPYHDVPGHCVARSPFRTWSTRMPWADPHPMQGGRLGAGLAGQAAAVAAGHRRGLAGWECSCCCSAWAWGPASATAKGIACH
jgi:hypothetical protein